MLCACGSEENPPKEIPDPVEPSPTSRPTATPVAATPTMPPAFVVPTATPTPVKEWARKDAWYVTDMVLRVGTKTFYYSLEKGKRTCYVDTSDKASRLTCKGELEMVVDREKGIYFCPSAFVLVVNTSNKTVNTTQTIDDSCGTLKNTQSLFDRDVAISISGYQSYTVTGFSGEYPVELRVYGEELYE
jgi:hypothetical protein